MAVIISTRPLDDALVDASTLAASGIKCLPAPMMAIKPLDIDLEKLFDDADAEALILTSRHAVGLIAASRWAEKPVFCVGESTARLAREAGIKEVITGPGDGLGLADIISKTKYKKIFWPSAADVGFDIAKPLSDHEITVIRHPVYKAAKTNILPDDVVTALKDGNVMAAMVHSGRAGLHLAEVMTKYGLTDKMGGIIVVAVSSRVAEQCKTGRHHGEWRKIITADAPHRSAMFDAVIALTLDPQSEINIKGN